MRYTTKEQSRELERLLKGSRGADLWYNEHYNFDTGNYFIMDDPELHQENKNSIPCWSLDALIDLLPKAIYGGREIYYLTILPGKDICRVGYMNLDDEYGNVCKQVEKDQDLFTTIWRLVIWAIKEKDIII